jgi:superfamily II RNA helicase
MKKKFEGWCEDHLKTCIEGCLLLKEALDNGVFSGGGKKIKEEKVARKMVDFFLGWRENGAIMSEKLGEFNVEKEIVNIALFQQLCGGIPIAPIADSIMPFCMLEWQKNMFMALRKRANVIVSAPTSSGKTMIALGYIIAFLMKDRCS